jgi:hypothetical protein
MNLIEYPLPSYTVLVNGTEIGFSDIINPQLTIEYTMLDVFDDDVRLDVAFTARTGVQADEDLSLSDIVCRLTWRDSEDGSVLYEIVGTLGLAPAETPKRGALRSLPDVANGSGYFSDFSVNLANIADPEGVFLGIENPAGNPRSSWSSKNYYSLTQQPIQNLGPSVVTQGYLSEIYEEFAGGTVRPTYMVLTDINDLSVLNMLMAVADRANNHLLLELDGSLPPLEVASLYEGLSITDQRVTAYYNGNKALPRDATSQNLPKVFRSAVGIQLGYRLLRNAATDQNGIPPLHIPIAGYDFPIRFRGMEVGYKLSESVLNRLAEAKIIPIRFEERWIFGDVLTSYDRIDSQLYLSNAAEIETYTANGVIQIIRRNLLKPMGNHIRQSTQQCTELLDQCVAAGLLVPSEELDGQPYQLSITPRAGREYDASDVIFNRRCETAARASYLTTTVER